MKFLYITLLFLFVAYESNGRNLRLQPDNINEIVAELTLEEKATLLVGGGNQGIPDGHGGMIGSTMKLVQGAAGTTAGIARLGIPQTVLTDGPAGVRIHAKRMNDTASYYATGFPVGVALASTWDTGLVREAGAALGNEVLEYGCDLLLAPGMNIQRSPLCGRNFEYYSEDPVLAGNIAAAYTNGVQSNGVGVSLKHFAVNSQETNRTGVDEIVDQRALREIYLKPFEIAIRESSPRTVMSSYNRINGTYAQESKELLTDILRDEWGFDGIVMTDWVGRRNTAAQMSAGNDLLMPGNATQAQDIVDMVRDGRLSIDDVNRNVSRMLGYIVSTPRYHAYHYSDRPDLKAHAEIARKVAADAMVLLKNDKNTLPLQPEATVALFGICSYDLIAGGLGSGNVNRPYVIDINEGLENAGIKVNEELLRIYTAYRDYSNAVYDAEHGPNGRYWGSPILPEMELSRQIIDQQAAKTDIAIITLGRQAGESGDRTIDNDFNLSELERKLIDEVCDAFHAANKRVIVIINSGSVIETASWAKRSDAILLAWQPGQEGGNSIADILTGAVTPSGKLTQTWPVAAMDHPSSKNFPIGINSNQAEPLYGNYYALPNYDYTLHREGIDIGYRYFTTEHREVSYPFGYGLSYTTFSYSKPTVKPTNDGFTATVTVTNTGTVPGKEAVQLYITAPVTNIRKPLRELKAFAKTPLIAPGESSVLTFNVTNNDLASFHINKSEWIADKGQYVISFGASVNDILCTTTYNLKKQITKPVKNVLAPIREL